VEREEGEAAIIERESSTVFRGEVAGMNERGVPRTRDDRRAEKCLTPGLLLERRERLAKHGEVAQSVVACTARSCCSGRRDMIDQDFNEQQ